MTPFGVCLTAMNEKLKRRMLNDAFKRFQRLPMLLPKSDAQDSRTENPAWQALPFSFIAKCVSTPDSTLQTLAE